MRIHKNGRYTRVYTTNAIINALDSTYGNVQEAASLLGCSAATIYRRVQQDPKVAVKFNSLAQYRIVNRSKPSSNKPRYVYFIRESWRQMVKIGVSATEGERKIQKHMQSNLPQELTLVHQSLVANPYKVETELHFRASSYHYRGEWFTLPDHVLRSLINYVCEREVRHAA